MRVGRRTFLNTAAVGAGAVAIGCAGGTESASTAAAQSGGASSSAPPSGLHPAIAALKPMTAGIVPISDDERRARIAKAQKLMGEQKIDAIFMEGTTSCFYFADMRWGQSERTFGVVIPAKGELAYVCPEVRGGSRARADQGVRRRSARAGRKTRARTS